jgi:N12 class adenine-specific DNA methylase
MGILSDVIREAGRASATPEKSGALTGQVDNREQAIVDRYKSEAPQVPLFQDLAEAKAEREIAARKQQRAQVEQAAPEMVAPVREMLSTLGDRRKTLEALRKMTPEQREEALKLAPGIAQQLGDDRGNAIERLGSAVGRGISHMVSQPVMELAGMGGTPEEIEYIRQLDAAASQEFNAYRPDDPWYQRGPLQAAEMVPWMATIVGGGGLGRAAATGAAKPIAAQMATRAGMGGATLRAAGRTGEIAGIAAAAFPGQYAQEVDQLKAIGMEDGAKLRLLAGGTAAIVGAIEGLIPNPFKAGTVPLTEGAVKAARQYLWEATKRAPAEMSEEFFQGVTSGLGQHVAQYIDQNAEDKTVAEAFELGWEQTKEAALPMAFLMGVPAVGRAGMSAARAHRLTQLQNLRAKGFISESDAKEAGIEGASRKERLANADAEIQQIEQEAAQTPPELPPSTPPALPNVPQVPPTLPGSPGATPTLPGQPPGLPGSSVTTQPPRIPGPQGSPPALPGSTPTQAATQPIAASSDDELMADWRSANPMPSYEGNRPGDIGWGDVEKWRKSYDAELAKRRSEATSQKEVVADSPTAESTIVDKPQTVEAGTEQTVKPSGDVVLGTGQGPQDVKGKLYREDPNAKTPSERLRTRQVIDPSEGVSLVTKDQFGKPIPEETQKAREEFVDKAKPGVEFGIKGFETSGPYRVMDDGQLLDTKTGRVMGDVQSRANQVQPGDITWTKEQSASTATPAVDAQSKGTAATPETLAWVERQGESEGVKTVYEAGNFKISEGEDGVFTASEVGKDGREFGLVTEWDSLEKAQAYLDKFISTKKNRTQADVEGVNAKASRDTDIANLTQAMGDNPDVNAVRTAKKYGLDISNKKAISDQIEKLKGTATVDRATPAADEKYPLPEYVRNEEEANMVRRRLEAGQSVDATTYEFYQDYLREKQKEPKQPEQTKGSGKTTMGTQALIGVNSQGRNVFEDENGVRSVQDGKTRVSEPVVMRPTREKGVVPVVDRDNRSDEFKTKDELKQPESKWQAETRAKLDAVPALKGSKFDMDEKAGTVKVTRSDGLKATIHFNSDEELAKAAMAKGKNPKSIYGRAVRRSETEFDIYVRSDANHTNILNHEVMHWLEFNGVVTKEEVEQYGGREAIAEKYGKWAEVKLRKKDSVFQRIYDALEAVFSSQRKFFEEVGERKKPQDKKPSAETAKGGKPKTSTIVDKSNEEELAKLKTAGIKVEKTPKGWMVTGLPNDLSQEMQDGIEFEGGRRNGSGYFFTENPTSRLGPTAEAIADENRKSDEATKAGLVSTPIGILSREDAEWYTEQRQQRLELAKQMLNETNTAVGELLGQFVPAAKRGLFKISLMKAAETGDPDTISRFDEMVDYSINHPELGLPQDESGLFERLLQSAIQERDLAKQIDDELATELASDKGDDSFEFGAQQTAIEGLEEDVARQERKDISEAKQAKSKKQFESDNSKGTQKTFLTDIYGDPTQGTLFDPDGVADEDQPQKGSPRGGGAGGAVMAVMTSDGTIYSDAKAATHYDVVEKFDLDSSDIIDGGFIIDGKYKMAMSDGGYAATEGEPEQVATVRRYADEYNAKQEKPTPASAETDKKPFLPKTPYGLGIMLRDRVVAKVQDLYDTKNYSESGLAATIKREVDSEFGKLTTEVAERGNLTDDVRDWINEFDANKFTGSVRSFMGRQETKSETTQPSADQVNVDSGAESKVKPEESQQAEFDEAALKALDNILQAETPKPSAADGKARPKPRTLKKPRKSEKTLAEAKTDLQAANDAAAKLMEKIRSKFMSGVDPELMAETVQVAYLYTKAGIKTFKGYVEAIVENFGESFAREFAPYMESGWRAIQSRGVNGVTDPAGKVEDFLTEAQDENTDKTAGAADQTTGEVDRRDSQDATSATDASVLEGEQTEDGGAVDGTGDTGGVRNRPGGKVRSGSSKADSGGVNESKRSGSDSGRASTNDSGERGAGRDRAPQSTRPNYHLTNPEAIIGGGPKAKFARNRKAIEIVRDIEESGRPPTAEELDTLAGYTGWGAFGQELFQGTWEVPQVQKGWEEENEWLRIYLGEEDWKSANNSIVNAHYTDPQTVIAMWDMLRRMGFDGGRVLEPSMGIGNFFSLMPRDLMDKSNLTGIELDNMTAKIAMLLHPQANIQQKGYQESQTPDNFYDVIVSNVPFGNYPIADRRYKQDFSVHNYFFKRAFDQVKPGGVIAFLTSNSTMDGKTQAKLMRAQIAEQGDLVTAIRLPSGAFQAYAGTKVVADLIVIRKRKPGEEPMAGQGWIKVVEMDTPAGQKIDVNEYWEANKQNILGTMTWGHGTTKRGPGMIVQQPENLQKLLDKAVESVPEGIINTDRTATQGRERPNTTAMRQNSVLSQDDELWIVKGEQLVPLIEFAGWYRKGSKKATIENNRQEIESLLDVREAMRAVLDQQAASEDAADARAELNRAYDAFVAKHGPIGKSAAAKHLRKAGDPAANTLLALEEKKGGKYAKRPIFQRPTVRQRKKVDKPTINDAFAMERNRSLDLNIQNIAEAANAPLDEVINQLDSEGKIYKTGTGGYDAADVFLSGNMARKLRQLEAAKAEGVEGLDRSIKAVTERIPAPIPYSQIEAKLGATWVESSDYTDFLSFLLNEPSTSFQVDRRVNGWKVSIPTDINNKTEAQHTHGHSGIEFSKLMNAAMNNAAVKLTMPDPQNPDSRITDPVGTAEANMKIGELREKFTNWIWTSPDRITRLSSVYNEEFNSTVTPKFDDVPLVFEGMAFQRGDQPLNLRKHQESAVWRGIVSGKGIFAHEVGTGKTLTMAALAMESRRLGLASKPLLLAHNANSMAVRNEILEAYPNANILYVDNLDAKNKDATLQAIATENWDLIVVPHSMAERFQLRPETVRALLKPEMDALEAAALEAFEESEASDYAKGEMPDSLDDMDADALKKLKEPTAKELVKERMKLQAKIDEAVQSMEKGTGIFFEDMAIDMVMVDEAHLFKKLPITTKQNIKGLNKSASQKGTMMMMLADYIRSSNNGRGVYIFTGTPITNTINEIYNMMRFVMAEEMEASGVRGWDGWFNNFATQETLTELSSGGTWENFDRLSSFVNLPELRQMVGQYMDIVFAEEMSEFKPRASRDGRSENPVGRPYKQVHNVTTEMLPAQERHSEDLKQRYTIFKNAPGKEKVRMMREAGGKYNPLIIEGEGVKLAMDPRLVGFGTKVGSDGKLTTNSETLDPKDPRLKVNRMLHNAMAHYHEHPQTSQMIFMQIGHDDWTTRVIGRTDAGKPITERVRVFNLAKEIKRRLMEEGVPEEEIALFSTMSKEKRTETAQLMKEGKVRFAIGSTETMGTGVNAQDELIAMHHLDAPWMPGDLEQRNGRGHRQGNKWNTVNEYRYLTEGPQDGRRWQVLLTKSRFIEKFMRADGTERTIEMDDVDMSDDGAGNDMEKTFSAAAGDPRIMMRIRLEDQVAKLKRSRNNHAKTITETVSRANQKIEGIKDRREEVDKLRADHQTWLDNRPAEGDKPSITLTLGTSAEASKVSNAIAGQQEVNDALKEREERYRNTIAAEVQIGEYRGLPLFMNNGMLFVGNSKQRSSWSMSSLQGIMANAPDRIVKIERSIEKDQRFIDMAHKAVGEPFPKQKQLDAKRAKLDALLAEMEANPDVSPPWLRAGAPIGTAVFHKGTEYEVAGHRKDTEVLYADGENFVALSAKELTDKDGTPIFPNLQEAATAETDSEDGTGGGTASMAIPTRQSRTARSKAEGERAGIAAADIQKTAERLFNVPIRQGGFNQRAAGIYKWITRRNTPSSPEVVRTAEDHYANLAVIAHEIAHHIDETTKVVRSMPKAVKNEVAGLDYEPQKARAFEGWAEFLRRYMTEPPIDVAGAMVPNPGIDAPQTLKWFEEKFLQEHPDVAKAIAEFRNYAQQFAQQSVFQRVATLISDRQPQDLSFKERWLAKSKRWVHRVKTAFVDKFHTLEWIQDEAKSRGYKGIGIYDMTMAYFMSATSHATIAFEEGVRDLQTGKPIGKTTLWGLREHLESDGEYQDATLYALARHTVFMGIKKPGYNTGMDIEDAEAFMDEVEARGQKDRFEKFAKDLAAFNNDLLKMLVKAGALAPSDAKTILAYYGGDNYFPLHRIENGEMGMFSGTGAGFVNLGKAVRRRSRKGSNRQIVDPVDATVAQAIRFYGRAIQARQQHTLAETLDPLMGGVGGMGGLMDRVDPKRVVNRGTIEEILGTLVQEGVVDPDDAKAMRIAAAMQGGMAMPSQDSLEWFADRHNIDLDDDIAMMDAARSEPDAMAFISLWRPDYTPNAAKRTVMIYDKNGNKLMYELDPDLYATATGMDEIQFGPFMSTLKEASRYFKSGAVGLSTGFGTANLLRDYWEFQGKAKHTKGLNSLGKPPEMLGRYVAAKVKHALGGKSNDALVRLYEETGGKVYSVVGHDVHGRKMYRRRRLGKTTMSRMGVALGRPMDTAERGLQSLQELIAISDAPPRLAEAEAAIKEEGFERRGDKWLDLTTNQLVDQLPEHVRIKAAVAMAEASINFKRIGSKGQYVETFMPFFNATIQAMYRQYKQVKGLKSAGRKDAEGMQAKRYLVYLSALVSTAIMYWLWRHDDDDWREQDEHLRDGFWTWGSNGKTYLRIPKPRDTGVVTNVVENMLDAWYHDDARPTGDILLRDFGSRLPTGGGFLRGAVEAYVADYDYFRGKDLTPYNMQKLPKEQQITPYTSRVSDTIGQLTGRYMGTSPIQVEHLLNSASGGLYHRMTDMYEAADDGRLGPEHVPFWRGVAINRHQARSVNDFYGALEEADKAGYREKADEGAVSDATTAKLAVMEGHAELMTKLRSLEDRKGKRREYENQPYIVGIARHALGYEELESNPNPLFASDVPEPIAEVMQDYKERAVMQATETLKKQTEYKSEDEYEGQRKSIVRGRAKLESLGLTLDQAKMALEQHWKKQHGSARDQGVLKGAVIKRSQQLKKIFEAE